MSLLRIYKKEALGISAVLLLSSFVGLGLAGLVGTAGAAVFLFLHVKHRPWLNRGHRAGAEGYSGANCENTVEALRALLALDTASPLQHLLYVEVDIQETVDGQLVVVHDRHLLRTFPQLAAKPPSEGWAKRTVQDLTLEQLRALGVGGREGVKVPTLKELMEACLEAGIRRPLVVEVKALRTDSARRQLMGLLRWYKAEVAEPLMQQVPERRFYPFGFLGVMAFPDAFASSFGALGSEQWQYWAGELEALGVPARCCFLHRVSLTHGAEVAETTQPQPLLASAANVS